MSPLNTSRRDILPLVLATTATALLIPSCGGNSPTAPTPQPPPPPRVTFVADASNPGVDAISLGLGSSTVDRFTLTLRAESVTDLYGYGVDVLFDPTIVTFESAAAGTFFDETGITVTTQAVEGPTGTLVVGQSRVGDVLGVSGSGLMLTMEFVTVTAGTTVIQLRNAAAFDSTGAPSNTDFFGGRITVPPAAQ